MTPPQQPTEERTMDYKQLLAKYMAHVVDCEGVTFVGHIHQHSDSPKFTDEEKATLERIADELGYRE